MRLFHLRLQESSFRTHSVPTTALPRRLSGLGCSSISPCQLCQFCQQGLAPTMNNHGWGGPQRRARSANEFSGLACGAVKTRAPWLPPGRTHTHHKRLFANTHTRLSSPLIAFPMHMFATWLWRKCLSRGCSKTAARSAALASGGLFASEGVVDVVFFTDPVRPVFCEARARRGEAFVNRRQLRCENTVLGIERQNRWR